MILVFHVQGFFLEFLAEQKKGQTDGTAGFVPGVFFGAKCSQIVLQLGRSFRTTSAFRRQFTSCVWVRSLIALDRLSCSF